MSLDVNTTSIAKQSRAGRLPPASNGPPGRGGASQRDGGVRLAGGARHLCRKASPPGRPRLRQPSRSGRPGMRRGCPVAGWRGAARPAELVGWANLSPVSSRAVYGGVAEVSIYVAAAARGQGVGRALLEGPGREFRSGRHLDVPGRASSPRTRPASPCTSPAAFASSAAASAWAAITGSGATRCCSSGAAVGSASMGRRAIALQPALLGHTYHAVTPT
jgi:GNAT superfamily N-acetyltransferase